MCPHCGYEDGQQNVSHQLPAGTVLRGQYLIGKVPGPGGFGITYLDWDQNLNTAAAVKEFFPRGSFGRDTSLSSENF